MLLISTGDDLPGESRTGDGYRYRLVAGGGPTLDEAWLSPPRVGDHALEAALGDLASASGVRPGSVLAPFAIRWIVVRGDNPFAVAFTDQVDLTPIPAGPELTVFENEAVIPRVSVSDGSDWTWSYAAASGPAAPGARVRIADNADPRWRPDWQADEWANSTSAAAGVAEVATDPVARGAAWGALALLVLGLVGLAVPGGGSPEGEDR